MKKKVTSIILKLDVYNSILDIAKKEKRSFTKQVEFILAEYIEKMKK